MLRFKALEWKCVAEQQKMEYRNARRPQMPVQEREEKKAYENGCQRQRID
jgi:hypothetical protein